MGHIVNSNDYRLIPEPVSNKVKVFAKEVDGSRVYIVHYIQSDQSMLCP